MVISALSFGQQQEIKAIQATVPQIKDSLRYIDALNRLAMLLYEQNLDSTFFYAREARAAADRLNYAKGKADALNNLGAVFEIRGDKQLALRYYNDAYNRYISMGDSANMVQLIMNIGLVYTETGEDRKAVRNFKEAISRGRELTKDSILSLVLANYLLVYPDSIPKDTVPVYIARIRQIASKYKDDRVLVASQQIEALYHLRQGHTDIAIIMLQQAVQKSLSMQLYYLSLDMLGGLGDLFVEKEPVKAVDYYVKALELSETKGYHAYTKVFATKLYKFYTYRNEVAAAQRYGSKLVELYETEEKLNVASGVDYIDYALKEQALEQETLRNKSHRIVNIVLTIICVLALVTGLIVYRLYLSRKKYAIAQEASNRELRLALGALEQSQQENSRIMKVIAHDLRSPISAIASFTEWMKEHPKGNFEEILRMLHKAASDALVLTEELLRLKLSVNDIQRKPMDLAVLLQHCVDLLQHKATEKGQQIVLNTIEATIIGDQEKLWRVFSNLINNAIKFSPNNTEIVVSVAIRESTVTTTVKDNGIGIPESLTDKIFNQSADAKRKGTAGEPSFGLGLAIAKQIVEAHHGKIWFGQSASGQGTCFYVALPLPNEQ